MRGLAYTRHQRERALRHAEPIVRRQLGSAFDPLRVLKMADDLKKCSCPMCNSGDPADRRMVKQADARMTWDRSRQWEE